MNNFAIRLLVVLCVWGMCPQFGLSQANLFSVRLFNARDGLPDNKVYQLLEPRHNPFLWAVTRNELCRFDGYRFQVVWEELPEAYGVFETSQGEFAIWHGRGSSEISRFNPSSGAKSSKKFADIPNLKGTVFQMWAQDTALFLTSEELSENRLHVWRLWPDFTLKPLFSLEWRQDWWFWQPYQFWFDEKKSVIWYKAQQPIIHRYDLNTGQNHTFTNNLPYKPSEIEWTVMGIQPATNQFFVHSVLTHEQLVWQEATQKFEQVPEKNRSLSAMKYLGRDSEGAMLFKSDAALWLRRGDGEWQTVPGDWSKFQFNGAFGKDFARQIYLTSLEGVLRLNMERPLFKYVIPGARKNDNFAFRGISSDPTGRVWMLSEMNGLYRMYPNEPSTLEKVALKNPSGTEIPMPLATDLKTDTKGNIIAVREGGTVLNLMRFNVTSGIIDTFLLDSISITAFEILRDGNILIGGNKFGGGARLISFNPETRQVQRLATGGAAEPFKAAPLFLLENTDGKIWVGSQNGLALFDLASRKWLDFKGNDATAHAFPVSVLLADGQTGLWCGTIGGGLRRLDLKTGAWKIYNMRDGLPANKIAGILPDHKGNLWVSTYDGLSFFHVDAGLFTNFFTANGLSHNEFNRHSFFEHPDGTLFFGGLNGVNFFKPAEVLGSFGQNNDSLLISSIDWFTPNGTTLQKQIFGFEQLQRISLPPDNRFCSIRLALANYLLPEANRFSWKLEGYDNDWQLNGTSNEITFHYLPAGTYRLHIRAANPTGIWGKSERVLIIKVREFWYKTIGFYLFLVAIIGGIFYFFYKTRIRQKLDVAETRRIRELEHLRSRLYTNITHEFRTPLTVILGLAEHLKEHGGQLATAETKQALSLIQRNGKNLLRLINQLLHLSKIESGAMKPKFIRTDVVFYLQYLTESFYSTARERGIRLSFHPEIPRAVIDIDEEKLQDIIFNLLSNALKFTGKNGEVMLYAKILGDEPAADKVVDNMTGARKNHQGLYANTFLQLKISDTGQGIAKEQLPYIFDRFYQVDYPGKGKNEGTGIGLALVKELVELLGGNISVESELGKGSVFTVLLPITKEADLMPDLSSKLVQAIDNREEAELPTGQQGAQSSDTPTLLIIEDNADVVSYITAILKNDYQIETAANGKIGVEKALESVPDIIISDVMMPEMDGYEVCDTLKNDERTSHIPIVLLTAKATQEDKVTGLRAGADAYLQKPFDKAELLVRLEKLVALRQRLQKRYANGAGFLDVSSSPNEESLENTPTLEDLFLQKIRQVILEKIGDPEFDHLDLCRSVQLSRTQLFRKIKALTGHNPTLFIRLLRLEQAMKLLKTTRMNISEIAYEVGFADPNYFSRVFSDRYGVAPSSLRAQ